jgi:YidC/Oxa1 family membrane protein insertase
MYLLFRSPTVDGTPNDLLAHDLFGAPLGSHWLSGAGPLSIQGAVFAGIFVLLALIGWLHARMLGRAAPPPAAAMLAAGTGRQPAAQPGATVTVLTRLAPYITVVMAAFVPLAAGLYLTTTTAWTLAERAVLGRRIHRQPRPPASGAASP